MAAMPPMTGIYNMPEEPDSPYVQYQTVSRLPSMARFDSECSRIAKRLRKVISGYLRESGFPTHNEVLGEVFGEYAIGEFPSDRTMCFFVGDLDAFTPEFICILQERVLADFPLWRLLAQFEEKSIGIYPQGTWLGKHWVKSPFTARHPAYRKWMQNAQKYRERRFGPLRRQLAYVQQRVSAARETATRNRFCVLGLFDRYVSRYESNHTVWILQTIKSNQVEVVPSCGPIRHSAVSKEGDIFPEFCKKFDPYTNVNPPYWLVTYLLDPALRHKFALKDEQGKVLGRFSSDEVIADRRLKAEEKRQVQSTTNRGKNKRRR